MAKETVYIILFRGVGGATQLPTALLRIALADAGFTQVATHINSGNAIVASALPRTRVVEKIAALCRTQFGFGKDIYAVTREEWRGLVDANPFRDAAEGKHVHAAVLTGDPPAGAHETLRSIAVEGEGIKLVCKVAYLHTPHGFGTSKFAAKFDKGIGVANTARNWNTVLKLMELAEKAAGEG